jgi:hypothetical protein
VVSACEATCLLRSSSDCASAPVVRAAVVMIAAKVYLLALPGMVLAVVQDVWRVLARTAWSSVEARALLVAAAIKGKDPGCGKD